MKDNRFAKYREPENSSAAILNQFALPDEPPELSRVESAASSFVQGLGSVVSSVPKAIGETAIAMGNMFGKNPVLGNPDDLTPEDTWTYQVGMAIDDYIDKNFAEDPRYGDDFWTKKVSEAAGYMTGFLAGGAVGAAAKIPSMASVGGLGVASGGVAGADDYKQVQEEAELPIDPDMRSKAFGLNGLLGASQALPITQLLKRIDRVSGGGVRKVMSKEGAREIGASGTVGGIEELVQEVFQQLGGNYIASDILEYDPERDVWDGGQEAGEVGFTLGFLMNALGAAIGMRKNKGKQTEEPEVETPIDEPKDQVESAVEGAKEKAVTTEERPIEQNNDTPFGDPDYVAPADPAIAEPMIGVPAKRMAGEFTTDEPGYPEAIDTEALNAQGEAERYKDQLDTLDKIKTYEDRKNKSAAALDQIDKDLETKKQSDFDAMEAARNEIAENISNLRIESDIQQPTLAEAFKKAETEKPTGNDIYRKGTKPFASKSSAMAHIKSKKLPKHIPVEIKNNQWVVRESKYIDGRLEDDAYRQNIADLDVKEKDKRVVELAVDGGKMGVQQAQRLSVILNEADAKEGEAPKKGEQENQFRVKGYLDEQRLEARQLRDYANQNKVADEYEHLAGEIFEETAYSDEMSGESRALYELAHEAKAVGVPDKFIEAALSSERPDYKIASDLRVLIQGDKANGQRRETSTEKVPAGRESGVSAEENTRAAIPEDTKPKKDLTKSDKVGKNWVKDESGKMIPPSKAAENERKKNNLLKKNINKEANEAATSPENNTPEPTQAQKEGGNYKLGHVAINGLDISIENPKGSVRSGEDKGGKQWSVEMKSHYGYIKKTEGADGDQVDVFIGDRAAEPQLSVYVIDQVNPKSRRFDEHKVMLGYPSEADARKAYAENYDKNWTGLSGVKAFSLDEFKDWLTNGDTRKRAAIPDNKKSLLKKKPKAKKSSEPKKKVAPLKAKGEKDPITRGLIPEEVSATINPIIDAWKNAPKVTVVKSVSDLPERLRDEATDKGLFDPNTNEIYLISDNLKNKDDAQRILFHEALGHYGLRELFGNELNPLLNQVALSYGRSGLKDIADLYDLDLRKKEDLLTAAEEKLARIAEDGSKPSLIAKLITFIRQFARKIGFKLDLSDSEIKDILAKARGAVVDGVKSKRGKTSGRPMRSQSNPIFYSNMTRVLNEKLPGSGPAKTLAMNIQSWVQKGHIKKEEAEWSGIVAWLNDQSGKVSKDAVMDFVRASEVRIQEVSETATYEASLLDGMKVFDTYKEAKDAIRAQKKWIENDSFYLDGDGERIEVYDHDGASLFHADKAEDGEWSYGKTNHYKDKGTKEDAMDAANEVISDVKEAWLDMASDKPESFGVTRYSDYQMPGGDNYTELLLTLPKNSKEKGEPYTSPHWGESNILAHVRFNERTDSKGKKVLFIEEIQSDWHQEGRKKGYGKNAVPDAPLKQSWPLLIMKRIIRYSAENDFDRIAWTTGAQQAERFDLSKKLDRIEYKKLDENTFDFAAYDKKGNMVVEEDGIDGDKVEELVGKELARKIINDEGSNEDYLPSKEWKAIESIDLVTGGEGMKAFYDKMLPSAINKYVKKWGGKVALADNSGMALYKAEERSGEKVHSLDLTEKMKSSVLKGQPLFSRESPKEPTKTQETSKKVIGEIKSHMSSAGAKGRKVMLGLMTGRMISDVYKNVWKGASSGNPLTNYQEHLQAMEALRNNTMADVGESIDRWIKLDKKEAERVSDIMLDATYYEIHPDRKQSSALDIPWANKQIKKYKRMALEAPAEAYKYVEKINVLEARIKKEELRASIYPGLSEKYEALSDEAKAVYEDVRDSYTKQWTDVQKALEERIGDHQKKGIISANEKKKSLSEISKMFDQALSKGPYFPLARFGDYVVTGKANKEFFREQYTSLYAANKAAEGFKEKGYDVDPVTKMRDMVHDQQNIPPGFISDVFSSLEDNGIKGKEIRDDIYQLLLQYAPDQSFVKHKIHRKKVVGYSKDSRRAFAHTMFHGAHHLGRLKYAHKMQNELDVMSEAIDTRKKNKDGKRVDKTAEDFMVEDRVLSSEVLEEMEKRHETIMNPIGHPLTHRAGSLAFIWYLGLSPAAGLVNMTQTALVALPQMAAKYGWRKAFNELRKATANYAGSEWDTKKGGWSLTRSMALSKSEKDFINEITRDGTIGTTLAQDVSGLSETDQRHSGQAAYSEANTKAMRVISGIFHYAEVYNRQVTALAAYRLAIDAGASPSSAKEKARELTFAGHFDYSGANRARLLKGNIVKVLTIFKQYSQHMAYTLIKNTHKSLKGESKEVKIEAFKTLTGILGMHFLAAGALGMPLSEEIFWIIDMFAGDEDEPFDSKTEFRNMIADKWNVTSSVVLSKGLINGLTPIDLHSRVSVNELFIRTPDRELDGKVAADYYLAQAAGPVYGIASNFAKGINDVSNGDVWRGIESMVPKAIRDPLKSIRYMNEGVLTKSTRDPVIEDTSLAEEVAQFIGFSPARSSDRYDARNAIKGKQNKISERRARLLSQLYLSTKAEDKDRIDDIYKQITAFGKANPRHAISGKDIRRSMKARYRASDLIDNGVFLQGRFQYLREEGRFAE